MNKTEVKEAAHLVEVYEKLHHFKNAMPFKIDTVILTFRNGKSTKSITIHNNIMIDKAQTIVEDFHETVENRLKELGVKVGE